MKSLGGRMAGNWSRIAVAAAVEYSGDKVTIVWARM